MRELIVFIIGTLLLMPFMHLLIHSYTCEKPKECKELNYNKVIRWMVKP